MAKALLNVQAGDLARYHQRQMALNGLWSRRQSGKSDQGDWQSCPMDQMQTMNSCNLW
jgi:hypothetical protein